MKVHSLGYRTDLIFPRFDGEIIDRGDYLVVRSPLNPTFYWGNFLLFPRPPQEGDLARWRELFAREIGSPPGTEHQAFAWDTTEAEEGFLDPFVQAGFSVSRDVVLATDELRPPRTPVAGITVRCLDKPSDWAQAIDLQVLCREPEHRESGYRVFRQHAMDRYRRMEEAGLGHWYGAFIGEQLVADLGIFHDGRGLGRYQSVETHPDFRRQGIAGTLVYEAGRRAMLEHGLDTLVIIAETDSSPSRLYESVGFRPAEKNVSLLWWDRRETDAPKFETPPAPAAG